MRTLMVGCGAAAALLLAAVPAAAGQVSGGTQLSGAAAGSDVVVRVTLKGVYPVVAYDFSLENRCWFKGKFTGPYDSAETYPLLGPWFAAPGGGSYSDETVDLGPVPTGSVCRVSISRGSTPVKGSSTSYTVS